MFRTALALYLSFVAFVGPGLCCCAFGEWFNSKSTPCKTQESPSRSCCHHAKQKHDSEPAHPQKKSPAPVCPCKQHQDIPVAPTVQASTISLLSYAHELDSCFELHSLVAEPVCFSVCGFYSGSLVHLVQPSAQDALRAPFVLLC